MLNLRHRHPRLWDLVVTGKVRFWQASEVTRRCADAGLGLAAALWVDQKMATSLLLLPWGRVKNLAVEWIIQADPELARQRAERAAANRHVTVEQIRDGHCDMYGRLDAVDGILFDQALDVVAESIDPSTGDREVRRAAAVGVLARNVFGQAQLPQPETPDQGEVAADGIGDCAAVSGEVFATPDQAWTPSVVVWSDSDWRWCWPARQCEHVPHRHQNGRPRRGFGASVV